MAIELAAVHSTAVWFCFALGRTAIGQLIVVFMVGCPCVMAISDSHALALECSKFLGIVVFRHVLLLYRMIL